MVPMFGPIVFDGWTARPDLNTFSRGDEVVRVEPKVMELFVRLAESSGAVVSKAALLDSVWPGVIVGEDSLTRAMSELRRALGDDARRPRIIETIPKRGYRLMPAVVGQLEVSAIDIAVIGAPPGVESLRPEMIPAQGPNAVPSATSPGASQRGVAIVASLVAMFASLLLWSRPWAETVSATGPALVLLAPFENRTSRSDLADTITGLLEQEVGRHGNLALVPAGRLSAVLARMRRPNAILDPETARQVMARDTDIAALVTGRALEVGDDVMVSVQLTDSSGDALASFAFHGANEAELRQDLRRMARFASVTASRPPASPLPSVTTSSLQALQLFAQAVEVADANWASIDGPWEAVFEKFREALRFDPEFAMAKVWLAMVLRTAEQSGLAYMGGTPNPDAYRQVAQESLVLAEGVSREEQLFIRGAALSVLDRSSEALAALEALEMARPSVFELRTRTLLRTLYSAKGQWQAMARQSIAIARMLPGDFDAMADAAQDLVLLGHPEARSYADRAGALLTPEAGQRENSCWRAAWVLHFDAYQQWAGGDYQAALESVQGIENTIAGQTEFMRDSLVTANGLFWLAFGRIERARAVFERGAHPGQRATNLFRIADLFDDLASMRDLLSEVDWAHNPVPYTHVGLFDRAHEIIAGGYASETARLHVRALETAASGSFREAATALQQVVDIRRENPTSGFYDTSVTLADMWERSGSASQAIRVLEEAVVTQPVYNVPGLTGAWWIKAQVKLVGAYRRAGRADDADALEAQVRQLMSVADPDHPFFRELEASAQLVADSGIQPSGTASRATR